MRKFIAALGLVLVASAHADEKAGWMFHVKFHNGKIETIPGLNHDTCETLRKTTLASSGPRGPSNKPVLGHLDPQEIEQIECLASDPVS